MTTSPRVDVTHHRLTANGLDQHYVTAGQGPPVVLLHGFPEFWYAWRHQIPVLAQSYTVIAPDLRPAPHGPRLRACGAVRHAHPPGWRHRRARPGTFRRGLDDGRIRGPQSEPRRHRRGSCDRPPGDPSSPRRRAARPAIELLERQATQINVLSGAVLNLARTVTAALRSGEDLPDGLRATVSELIEALSSLASHDTAAASRAADQAVSRIVDQQPASRTRAPLIALLTLGCGRDLEHLVVLSVSAPHPE